jgi:hypothetical protein
VIQTRAVIQTGTHVCVECLWFVLFRQQLGSAGSQLQKAMCSVDSSTAIGALQSWQSMTARSHGAEWQLAPTRTPLQSHHQAKISARLCVSQRLAAQPP